MFPNSPEHRNKHLNAGSIRFSQMTAGIFENPDVSLLITSSKIQLELNDSENVVRVPAFLWSIFLIFPEFFFSFFFLFSFSVFFCLHVMIMSYPERGREPVLNTVTGIGLEIKNTDMPTGIYSNYFKISGHSS